MAKAAFIGLGAMGSRMAANLLKAGYEVTVSDPATDAVRKLVDLGAKAAGRAREAAAGNDFVLTMVRDDEISRKGWLDSTSGALAGMKDGAVAIECSTISPAWALELGDAFIDSGHSICQYGALLCLSLFAALQSCRDGWFDRGRAIALPLSGLPNEVVTTSITTAAVMVVASP